MIAGLPGPFESAVIKAGRWLAAKCSRAQPASREGHQPQAKAKALSPREHTSAFLVDTIEPSVAGSAVSLRSLNELYLGWCSTSRQPPLSPRELGSELKAITSVLGLRTDLTEGDVLIGGIQLRTRGR